MKMNEATDSKRAKDTITSRRLLNKLVRFVLFVFEKEIRGDLICAIRAICVTI